MANFSHIIFDLDGTLTDNTRGIRNSLLYALEHMQIHGYSEDVLDKFIGPPLQWGFSQLFGLNERNTKLAVEYFRDYYSENGWHENEPYPGIYQLLEDLHFAGVKMYVATSKLEKFAQQIIEHFEFDKYIIQLKGADYGGHSANKTSIISDILTVHRIKPFLNVAMVGDTVYDIEGGKAKGLTTVAVAYGFGKDEDLKNANPDYYVETVEELYEVLMG
ncbi:HAD hydrolase-like protein [Maribellus maritimus]|uniref:HAD hydrolase-like protein n=1 Tax=Maribellus maritimus TaxID=2870838 RepID=UPI001EEA9BD1|nr:HAD hydrolase-like protein [Maribellus maritimus]MCG6188759.1 HAD hydrolase-like protein [Maribellus maritimus]